MFEFLFKYLEHFDKKDFGKWIIDDEHKETPNDPIQFPFVDYNRYVDAFIEEVCDFAITNKLTNYNLVDGKTIGYDSPNKDIFYKILEITRAEKFCDGYVLGKLEDGTIQNLILILRRRYEVVNKAIEYLKDLPKKKETYVFECFADGARFRLESDCSNSEAFILNDMFHKERTKQKIRIHWTGKDEEGRPMIIGMPWAVPFYKV